MSFQIFSLHSTDVRRMLSRAVDASTNLLPNGIGLALSALAVLSVIYTYLLHRFSIQPIITILPHDDYKKHYQQRAKYIAAAEREQQELDAKRKHIVSSAPFPFKKLPPEIAIAALAYCANWPSTYVSLLLVSKRCQRLAYTACLPDMPIWLIRPEQVHSFHSFLCKNPRLAALVRSMWLTPLREDLLPIAIDVLKKSTNLRSLAANVYIVQESITLKDGRSSHPFCTDFTFLSTAPGSWASFLQTSTGLTFFQQLTRLRLMGDRVPTGTPLPNLVQLSYGSDLVEEDPATGMRALEDKETFPSLQTVIVTRSRQSAGGLRVSRALHARCFTLELPRSRTELETWCDSVRERGIWELCSNRP